MAVNPIYTFALSAWRNGTKMAEMEAHPVYGAGLAKDFERESGQMFFREKLNGGLVFAGVDYDFIVGQPFDTKFVLEIGANFHAGIYWKGAFFKTDCEFDDDDCKVSVSPQVDDAYKAVLDGLDKEFNLIELAPEIIPVQMDRRAMIQVYVAGQSTVGCFLSGMWWEESCLPVTSDSDLTNRYHFAHNKSIRAIEVTAGLASNPEVPDVYYGNAPTDPSFPPAGAGYQYELSNGAYTFQYRVYHPYSTSPDWREDISIIHGGTTMWRRRRENINAFSTPPYTATLSPVGGGAVGNVAIYVHDFNIYSRYVCDVTSAGGQSTYALPSDDLVMNNRNYTRALGYNLSNTIWIWDVLSSAPTEWGRYDDGRYYVAPPVPGSAVYPMARGVWGRLSIWFASYTFDSVVEPLFRKRFTLRDSFPVSSVLSVLLARVAPGITHEGTSAYSEFLYGTNPITGESDMRVLITPKSNLVNSQYDQPAQKAPITLGQVLEMLRYCYQCYWWIDGDKLRIEHIAFFKGGGQYFGTPITDIDLTGYKAVRSGKEWAFAENKYTFEKPETAERYEFGWSDTATAPFEGAPIIVKSGYVEQGRVEEVRISAFNADVDYIMLNPSEISNDGFVLLYAQEEAGDMVLPYYQMYFKGVDVILQNGFASFAYLQRFWAYDMPAPDCECDGQEFPVQGTMRLKRQEVSFPVGDDPDLLKLIKTFLGDGQIEKLSVNLCSRMAAATLSYDTESAE